MIEIGEYVRTKDGHIAKYIEKLTKDEDVSDGMLFDSFIYGKYKNIRYSFLKEIMVKHSKQLIDLIEVKDIVEIRTGLYSSFKYFVESEDDLLLLEEKVKESWNIETILTKESYMANCYKV